MSKYSLIVFDMDGTLADTSPGILNSHRYAHQAMGRAIPDEAVLRSVIGGPLLRTYQERFGFSESDARTAVAHYRNYYRRSGVFQAALYPKIPELLRGLLAHGMSLGVATLKAETFAVDMLKRMGVYDCFSAVCGMDENDTRTKAELIRQCMKLTGTASNETLLVGDSMHDWEGACTAGVGFIGVTYGFGFSAAEAYTDFLICHSPKEILLKIENNL